MNINKWLQKKPKRKKSGAKVKQDLTDNIAKKSGGIGNIARQRKRQDKILRDIMKGN